MFAFFFLSLHPVYFPPLFLEKKAEKCLYIVPKIQVKGYLIKNGIILLEGIDDLEFKFLTRKESEI